MPHDLQLLKERMRAHDLIPGGGDIVAFLGFLFGPGECQGTCQHCASCADSCSSCQAGNSSGPQS